jgi:GGDEF domain-containing protein
LRSQIRPEEFVVVLVETTLDAALDVAERVRAETETPASAEQPIALIGAQVAHLRLPVREVLPNCAISRVCSS